MPAASFLLRLAPALAAAALISAPAPASASTSQAAALPCVDVAGVVTVNCPAPDPATPVVKPKPTPKPKAKGCTGATLLPAADNLAKLDRATLCLLNRERTKRHLVALKRQPTLDGAATRFAAQLVQERFFDHTAPDGTTMVDRVRATTYLTGRLRRWSLGENIAYGTGALGTPQSIVTSWMKSAGHRTNILDPAFREIGLGVALGSPDGPTGATYVNDFGRRDR